MLSILRPISAGLLALTLLGAAPARVGDARSTPGAPIARRSLSSSARGVGAPLLSAAPAPPGWRGFTYGGALAPGGAGRTTLRIPGYSLAYPPHWAAHLWPDTLAAYGRLDLQSPAGSTIDTLMIPLRTGGPALSDLIARDLSYLSGATRDSVPLPLGTAVRLSGVPASGYAGRPIQILYLRRGAVVYRLFSSRQAGSPEGGALVAVASTLRALAPTGGPPPATTPPPPPPPTVGTCCHCPAWGAGWGTVLTSLDGVAVYSNAGDVNNGCTGTYGILYQCVELAQRYFAVRWGYPAIWAGVEAAADMRANHPGDIQFIPNGGSPGPREGDAIIFYGDDFGHVALISGVDRRAGRIDMVEENWSPTGVASLPIYADNTVGIRDSAFGSYTVAGWLHSPKNT